MTRLQPALSQSLLTKTAELLAQAVPTLDQTPAHDLLMRTAGANQSLSQVRDYLMQHPDGLREPHSDAPLDE